MNKTTTIQVLGNIYNNILKGVELGKTLIMLQGSARAGKTYNTMIYIIQVCLSTVVKVSIVRQSLPVIKRSVLEDFKDIMLKMGIFEDKRLNKTECKYYFANGSVLEFFSADDEQKLRGSYRDILYINEANEISFYAFSMLRQRTYKYTIVDYNPSFTEEHWLYPLMSDKRSYHFISTFMDNVFLPEPAREEILSYKETNPALWQIFGLGEFAIVDGLVFPKENWDTIANDEYPSWKKEEVLGLDWGFKSDPSTAVGVIIIGDDIYVRQIYYEYGLQTQDIAERLSPYSSNYKYCDIDNRLITELEMNGVTLLNPTKKNGDSILSGIRIMNQKHIHITESSTDVIKEFKNYVYKKDRNGVTMYDKNPVGKFDHCFTGETMIKTLDGEKRIDEIKVGDFVYTGNGSRQVVKFFDNGIQDVCEYKITYENGTSITINSTQSHKVKTSRGWVQIKDLKAGDAVFIFNSSFRRTKDVAQLCSVKEISVLSERKEHTYNLMIDEIHEYFANGLLVSNCVDAIRYAVLAEFTNTEIEEDIPLTKESLNLFI